MTTIVKAIRVALEELLPNAAPISATAESFLTGGGAMLRNLDLRIRQETGLPVSIADNPVILVLGTGKMLEDFKLLRKVSLN